MKYEIDMCTIRFSAAVFSHVLPVSAPPSMGGQKSASTAKKASQKMTSPKKLRREEG